jgi:hypothetical protein
LKAKKAKKKEYKVFREAKEFYNRRKIKRREGEKERAKWLKPESWQHFLQLLVESEVDFASKPTQREASPQN